MDKLKPIFSGDYSRDMWETINSLDALSTGDDMRELLYLIGCRLQEFESKVDAIDTRHQDPTRIEVDGNEMSIVVYCAGKYGARQAQDKTAIILDYLRNSTDV